MAETKTMAAAGVSPTRAAAREEPDDPTAGLEPAMAEAVALARNGDWPAAEAVVHASLRALPPEALPQAYIACVDLVARNLVAGRVAEDPGRGRPVTANIVPPAPAARPRLLTFPDPARDYAHAVLTALRGRLTARRPDRIRQAS